MIKKLLLFLIASLLITMSAILILSNRNLRLIIDESQNEIYREKLDMIWLELNVYDQRLEQTGLREAYLEDFQNSALRDIRNKYYGDSPKDIYPFILDANENVLLHPIMNDDNRDMFILTEKHFPDVDSGEIYDIFNSVEKWYIYKRFSQWNWIICFAVPMDLKHEDLHSFRQMMILIILFFSSLLIAFSVVMLIRFFKPVKALTAASRAMAEGGWSDAVQVEGNDELAILADSFNAMQRSIREKMEDLTNARSFISDIIDSMPSAIISLDSGGRITRMNNLAEKLIKVPLSEAEGSLLWETCPPLCGEKENILDSIKTNRNHLSSSIHFNENSKDFEMVIYSLQKDKEGGAVLRIDDVSEKKKMEEQMFQFQKMDALGQLVGGVAHDFNNMLGGVIAAADLLKGSLPEEDRNQQLIDMILDASGRASDLVSNLLTFSRKTDRNFSTEDLHKIIYRTVSILKRTLDRNIGINVKAGAETSLFTGGDVKIENLIMNLAINASHAMPDGGLLSIKTKNMDLDEYYCSQTPFEIEPGRYIEMEIRDTGTGIAPEIIDRIFDPFFTTKETGKGTGLGLSSVFGTVQEHSGAISVYSEPGTGTVFHVYLPAVELSATAQPHEKISWQGSATVLLVDDEEIIRKTARMILEGMGLTVITAVDGIEALEHFRLHSAAVDLVITDMIMPRMGGRELIKELNLIKPDVKIVVSSGFTKEDDLKELKNHGIEEFIQKPFSREELTRVMKEIFS